MHLSFRWYGPADPVSLSHIRQIPGVETVVSALHDVPVGKPDRDRYTDAFCRSLERVGALEIDVVCYNFMPVVDWTRTDMSTPLPDGSTTLAYDHEGLADLSPNDLSRLPGWSSAHPSSFHAEAYQSVSSDDLWAHLAYFLERVVPVAETAGVQLALHPDDPPWPILGLPRILTSGAALERATQLVDSPANGITFCTGSLGANPTQNLPALARRLADCIHFVHARNVSVTGTRQFHETAHRDGDIDLSAVLQALKHSGFEGPLRPDHGRMIWGEEGRPGYGLHDRALGITYLQGLWEAL